MGIWENSVTIIKGKCSKSVYKWVSILQYTGWDKNSFTFVNIWSHLFFIVLFSIGMTINYFCPALGSSWELPVCLGINQNLPSAELSQRTSLFLFQCRNSVFIGLLGLCLDVMTQGNAGVIPGSHSSNRVSVSNLTIHAGTTKSNYLFSQLIFHLACGHCHCSTTLNEGEPKWKEILNNGKIFSEDFVKNMTR